MTQWLWFVGLLIGAPVVTWLCIRLGVTLRRPGGSSLGPALAELNAAFDPASRNVEAVQAQRPVDSPDDDPPR
ncbi:MAG: hypothetical protein JWR84_1414 [Caulobacter sp.]|nr:hypothetical protein [Caulobacter sp.]